MPAAHAGRDEVGPGQLITCKVELARANGIAGPMAQTEFNGVGVPVWDPERMALVQSHFVPAKDIKSATQAKSMRDFAREHNVKYYYEVGEGGIEHALLPEQGLAVPGMLIIGADSHTCTYGGVGAFSTGVGSTDLAAVWATGEIWLRVPETLRFVVAGGLSASNVAEVMSLLAPDAVDVSSGVESSPGKKDLRLIDEFAGAVRSATAKRE